MTEKKNGAAHAKVTTAAKPAGEKKAKTKLAFQPLLNKRLDKVEHNLKLVERMFIRAGKGITNVTAALAALASSRSDISDLPADFKPARAAASVQPMTEGTKVEIVSERRSRYEGLFTPDELSGTWTVVKATPTSVSCTSDGSGIKSAFPRRDVQLPGVVRVKKPRKTKKAAEGANTAAA